MIDLDGTPNKGRLGANAILAVSMAVARAAAESCGVPLYRYLGGAGATTLPVPMMNIINGGSHADNTIDFEEFMIVPNCAGSFHEALRIGCEVYRSLKATLRKRSIATVIGDEGGFAPNLGSNEKPCELIVQAIADAGYEPGKDVAMAIDVAAESFFEDGVYHLRRSGQGSKNRDQMLGVLGSLIHRFPLVAIEDGLASEDWLGFVTQTSLFGWKIQIVGDDLYATNRVQIAEGVAKGATNASLIRPSQIGTVTETIEAVKLCRSAGWNFIVADRAGDTEDTFTADLAVAMGGGQIKCGAPCRGERTAKYNRLLEIEDELGDAARFRSPLQWKPWAQAAQENGRH
jgi:enolase